MIIATNRQAFYDYEIIDTLEAGIILTGPEIKGIRAHKVTLAGSYAKLLNGELFWIGGHITAGHQSTHDQRSRKLLVKKKEISRLAGLLQKSLTLMPLKIVLKHGLAKLDIGIARRRKKWDKRELIKKRELSHTVRDQD